MYLWWSLCTFSLQATWGCTSGGVYVPFLYTPREDVHLVEFMYLSLHATWGCTSGGVYVPFLYTQCEDVPLVEFMYLGFTRMPGESCCRWLRSFLLCFSDIFWALINPLVCWLYMSQRKITRGLCVCVCVCMCMCVCVYVCVCMCTCVSVCICMGVCMWCCVSVCMCGVVWCVCVMWCECVWMCVCVVKWMYPYVFVSTPSSYEMGHHK